MKIGLALAGGGGKGAYQIGVLKALHFSGFGNSIQAVSGTSVGALNAALFVNDDIELAVNMWRTISPNKILSIKPPEIIKALLATGNYNNVHKLKKYSKSLEGFGVFSRAGLLQMIQESIDLNKVSSSNISVYASCTAIPECEKTYFQLNGLPPSTIQQILLASSAIPGIFKPEIIDDIKYIDGGLLDNVPIAPLYQIGCDIIIAVLLDRSATINKSLFPKAKIFEIVPQNAQGNTISGTLNFEGSKAEVRIQQGYRDAMSILKPIAAMAQNDQTTTRKMNQLIAEDRSFQDKNRTLQFEIEQKIHSLTNRIERNSHE